MLKFYLTLNCLFNNYIFFKTINEKLIIATINATNIIIFKCRENAIVNNTKKKTIKTFVKKISLFFRYYFFFVVFYYFNLKTKCISTLRNLKFILLNFNNLRHKQYL